MDQQNQHRLGLDGSVQEHTQSSTINQSPDTNEANRPAPLRFQRSAESFGRRHHISRRIKSGTWRTRMQKTKCWRCEVESHHTASSQVLYHGYRNVMHGLNVTWNGLKETLRYTCFCRYRGYEEEDADDVSEVEERARLGRLGGDLSAVRRY